MDTTIVGGEASRVAKERHHESLKFEAITKHVKVLEETGVVTRAVEGRTHILSLELDVLREVAEWMDRQRAI